MPRGPDKGPRKRKTLSPADFGSRKKRPAWAEEQTLRRVILGPSLRYYRVVLLYYRERRTFREIARETGLTQDSIGVMVMKVRRAMRAKIEHTSAPIGAKVTGWDKRTEWIGQSMVTRSPGNRGTGRTTHVPLMFNDTLLRKCIFAAAMDKLQLAREYWLENRTIKELAASRGLSMSAVGLRLWQLKRLMEHPPARRYRVRVRLTRIC
jgi:hypothetical protein